jgi:hypothetical protein
MPRANSVFALLLLLGPGTAHGADDRRSPSSGEDGGQTAQTDRLPRDVGAILARLDRIERENQALLEEVRALRSEVSALREQPPAVSPEAAAAIQEKVDVQAARIDELDQTKVGSTQRFPIQLSGMVLFNAFANSHQSGGVEYPTLAAPPGLARDGATMQQTILGLEFRGPHTIWGGVAHASVYADFFNYLNNSIYAPVSPIYAVYRDQMLRLRTAMIQIDWKTRNVMAGLEKPIFNPRDPSSLAQVGVSPLTGAGNLWLWLPQARMEQDFKFDPSSGLRARLGVVATREVGPYPGSPLPGTIEPVRPGLEGRFEFFHKLDERRTIEIAPGFHTSTTRAGGSSIPSRLVSVDWFMNPWGRLELTGFFYYGENVAHLGTGDIRQGFYFENGIGHSVGSTGGWAQLTLHALPRLDFHFFSGQQDDRNSDLAIGGIGKNLLYGANLYYRLAPNVLLGPEVSQLRTVYIGGAGTRLNNHYDLALAYLF